MPLTRGRILGWLRRGPDGLQFVYHERSEPDAVGEELPNRQAAWKEATINAGQTLQSLNGTLKPGCD